MSTNIHRLHYSSIGVILFNIYFTYEYCFHFEPLSYTSLLLLLIGKCLCSKSFLRDLSRDAASHVEWLELLAALDFIQCNLGLVKRF